GKTGGTGRLADWGRVAELKREGRRVVLAGGISAANAADAERTGADVLDANSSLETSPGEKSAVKLLEFFHALRGG
ncbi:MAG: bifunctional indole-3-glycerol phosphate synthase/phosphoribosylanthranilate isomerase, partial [Kiritimatiellae bacterium]|nr:bifunctional indole-3-glycerol phosphate synthase/phosphoribosylanthranilate isomerase [Kiritimatiellia bacterium]